jgi:hypothetical protein
MNGTYLHVVWDKTPPALESAPSQIERMPIVTTDRTLIDRIAVDAIRTQLFTTRSAAERARILEALVRVIYEYVKFQPDGGSGGNGSAERNAVAAILAAAAHHTFRSR